MTNIKLAIYSLVGLGLLVFMGRIVHPPQPKDLVSPVDLVSLGQNIINQPAAFLGNSFRSYNFTDSNLSPIIKPLIPKDNGEMAIVVESLSNDQSGITDSFYYNEQQIIPSASLYKLFVLAEVMDEVEQGNLKEDQTLSSSRAHLEEVLGGPEYGYEDAGETISYTVDEAMERVASVSDNYAAILLAEKVSWEKVQAQADKLGAKHTTIKSPISTSASDIALFFSLLYKKQIVSESASNKIIELLSDARLNNRIPAKLPAGLQIAHKTGELDDVRNDAGIVFLKDKPYLIVMMSHDLDSIDNSISSMSDISKAVYDYFESK